MLIWVPTQPVADGLAGLDGVAVEVVSPDGTGLPASAAEVEFYVPAFFPGPDALTAMSADAEAQGGADTDGRVRPDPAARPGRGRALQRPRGARREHRRVGGYRDLVVAA